MYDSASTAWGTTETDQPSLASNAGSARGLRIAWFGHAEGKRADGLSTYSREVVQALARRGAEVKFFAHSPDGQQFPDVAHVSLPAMRLGDVTIAHPRSSRQIARELKAFRPHVAHCSWSFSLHDGYVGRAASNSGAASVATFHVPYGAPGTSRGRLLRGVYRYHVRNLRAYDACIALSSEQQSLLVAAGLPEERLHVVNNGVDTENFRPEISSLKQELNAKFVVTYMGRIDPEKRVLQLLESFLAQGWPDDHVLVIAGRGSQDSRLQRFAQRHKNIRVLGMVTNHQQRLKILRGTDIYALPSTAEGLSLSMLEAMATGCAVVATNAGEDGRALADAGICLPIYPLEPALGKALALLHADAQLRGDLGQRARQRVLSLYGMETHVDQLLNLYAGLRRRQPAPG